MNAPKHSFVSPDDAPRRSTSTTKWSWLRDIILNKLKPDGDAVKFVEPDKETAQRAQSAAQNCRKRLRKLNSSAKIRTAIAPADNKQGWTVWVCLVSN